MTKMFSWLNVWKRREANRKAGIRRKVFACVHSYPKIPASSVYLKTDGIESADVMEALTELAGDGLIESEEGRYEGITVAVTLFSVKKGDAILIAALME